MKAGVDDSWLFYAGCFADRGDVPTHWHAGTEIVVVTEGSCVIELAGQAFEGKPGTLFILPPNVPQVQRTLQFTRTTYVIFQSDSFDASARTMQIEIDGFLCRWMADLATLQGLPHQRGASVMQALLSAVVKELRRIEVKYQERDTHHPAVALAMAFLEETFAQPFNIDALSDRAGVSASHLMSLFRTHLAKSPLQCQRDLRMRLARTLLLDPHQSIKRVAHRCGYDDISYFIRVFRSQVGEPPGVWRTANHFTNSSES